MLHKSGQWNENSFSVGTSRQREENFLSLLLQPSWKSQCSGAWVEDHSLIVVGELFFFLKLLQAGTCSKCII